MAKKEKSGKTGKKQRSSAHPSGSTGAKPRKKGPDGSDPASPGAVVSPSRRLRAGEAAPPSSAAPVTVLLDPGPTSSSATATATAPTTALITTLAALANRSALVVDAKVRAAGLRTPELSVYGLLTSGGRLTPGEISESTGLAATTVSSLLRRAEARGDIERVPNPRDARSSLLVLTDSGRFRYTEALVYLDPLVRELKQPGVPTGTQVVAALGVVRRWVDAMATGEARG